MKNNECVFTDSFGNVLFNIASGDKMVIQYPNNKDQILVCESVDNDRVKIGRTTWQADRFAKDAEQRGIVYYPENPRPSDILDTYHIYQIPADGKADYLFHTFNIAKGKIKISDYKLVYSCVLSPSTDLEKLFIIHNREDRPLSSSIRSMSISDILVTRRRGVVESYYVDSIGFKCIDSFA